MTNGFSHPYQMDESTFIFRGSVSDFFISFFDEKQKSKQNSPSWDAAIRRHIWGYSVCLCPIKRTSGLYGKQNSPMRLKSEPICVNGGAVAWWLTPRTPDPEDSGHRVVSLSKTYLLPKSTGYTQEAVALSQHD